MRVGDEKISNKIRCTSTSLAGAEEVVHKGLAKV